MAWNDMTYFWRETGGQMGILKDQSEEELDFCCRVILSALSKWVLTAIAGNGPSVSVERIKQIVRDKYTGYLKLLPAEAAMQYGDIDEKVYQLLLENGAFYHLQNWVRLPPYKRIPGEMVSFVRGLLPEENVFFSGLAPIIQEAENEVSDLADAFMLWPLGAEETLELTWKRSRRTDHGIHLEEYLNLERKEGSYFSSHKKPDWPFSLARNRRPGNPHSFDYYFLKDAEIRRIPEDFLDVSIQDYVRLAMMNKIKRQNVSASVREHIVVIHIGYRLPAPDLRFMRYVSWLADIREPENAFHFVLHPLVWPAVRKRLITLGYEVNEIHD